MKILHNPEVKKQIAVLAFISVLFTSAGFTLGIGSGLLMLLFSVLNMAGFFLYLKRRYREIARLSLEIDRVLHGEENLDFSSCKEGDLEILKDEIYKMTVRLREQTDRLKTDKIQLADSLADISHQIRTPLTSVNLMMARLQNPELSKEERTQILMNANKMLRRIDWLITALLKMSKLDAGAIILEKEEIAAEEFLRQALEPLEISMEIHSQCSELHVDKTISFIGDRTWTLEAVGNVLKNCMEYTPEGGKIDIFAEENPLYTELRVCDSGPGILKEDLPHLFERFYRGKNAGDGSFGIGLALARMILAKENGTITAENNPKGGSIFRIRIYKGAV